MTALRWRSVVVVGLVAAAIAAAAEPSAIAERCYVGPTAVCVPDPRRPVPSPSPPHASPSPVPQTRLQFDWRPIPELEKEMLEMINSERAKAGVAPVEEEPLISEVARGHSAVMGGRSYIWHNMEFVEWARGLGAKAIGENVDLNVNPAGSHAAFMNSPPHRRNILDPRFTHVGIGIWREPAPYGFVFVTQDFVRLEGGEQLTSPSEPGSAAGAPGFSWFEATRATRAGEPPSSGEAASSTDGNWWLASGAAAGGAGAAVWYANRRVWRKRTKGSAAG